MTEPRKICTKCQRRRPVGLFRWQGSRRASWCDPCFVRTPEENHHRNRQLQLNRKERRLIHAAKHRARLKQLPFDLHQHRDLIRDRVYAGVCELSGLPLDLEAEHAATWNSPSIDRIKPELGYIYSNIRVVCHALNTAIGAWGEEQTAVLMQAWLDKRNVI